MDIEPTTMDLEDGVKATVTVERVGNDLIVRSVRITAPPTSTRGITAEMLRTLSLVSAARDYRQQEIVREDYLLLDAPEVSPRPTAGRWSSLTDEDLARYAEWYLIAVAKQPQSPVQFMHKQTGESAAKIRDRLKACNKFGWLAGTVRGKAGAFPGPKLIEHRVAHAPHPLGEVVEEHLTPGEPPGRLFKEVMRALDVPEDQIEGMKVQDADETAGKDHDHA